MNNSLKQMPRKEDKVRGIIQWQLLWAKSQLTMVCGTGTSWGRNGFCVFNTPGVFLFNVFVSVFLNLHRLLAVTYPVSRCFITYTLCVKIVSFCLFWISHLLALFECPSHLHRKKQWKNVSASIDSHFKYWKQLQTSVLSFWGPPGTMQVHSQKTELQVLYQVRPTD